MHRIHQYQIVRNGIQCVNKILGVYGSLYNWLLLRLCPIYKLYTCHFFKPWMIVICVCSGQRYFRLHRKQWHKRSPHSWHTPNVSCLYYTSKNKNDILKSFSSYACYLYYCEHNMLSGFILIRHAKALRNGSFQGGVAKKSAFKIQSYEKRTM